MIRTTNLMKNNTLIHNIMRHQQDMDQAENQLATGQKIRKPSDNPGVATNQMYYRTRVGELDQFEENITTATDRLNHTDGELARVGDIMHRIRDLTVQASNGIYQGDDGFELRVSIAKEIDQHLRSLIEIANGKDATGRPLFGGHVTQQDPFEITSGTIPGIPGLDSRDQILSVAYRGDDGKRLAEVERNQYVDVNFAGNQVFWGTNMTLTSGVDSSGYRALNDQKIRIDGKVLNISAGDTTDDIIDKINDSGLELQASRIGQDFLSLRTTSPHQIMLEDLEGGTVLKDLGLVTSGSEQPPGNYAETARVSGMSLFDTVIKLRNDLMAKDQLEIGGRDLGMLDESMNNLLRYRSEVGARQNRLEDHMKRVSWDKTYMTELLAKSEGVDIPETIMNLKWLETVHNYSLNVGSRVIRPTLLDFLR